jgi:AcrR family transcriptional regulator
MSRPSQNLDKVLIEFGKEMMSEAGVSGLSIRQVCSRAKVNPGMFKYHFENRANFLRIIHDQLYDEFFAFLQEAADKESNPLDKLRACIITMCRVCREKRKLFSSLILDHMNGSLDEILPKEDMVPKDLLLILKLIAESKADGYLPQHISDFQIASLLIPAAIIPILAEQEIKELAQNFPLPFAIDLASESACIERVDILLKGLRT